MISHILFNHIILFIIFINLIEANDQSSALKNQIQDNNQPSLLEYKIKNNNQLLFHENKNTSSLRNELPKGFTFVDENNIYGPITVDRKLDNGKKRNLYSIIRNENDSFYYKYDQFAKLPDSKEVKSEYLCEKVVRYRPEGMEGYDISCPAHYSIVIDKAFYGRYANDTTHCASNVNFTNDLLSKLKTDCGSDKKKYIQKLCEGKSYCSILPANILLDDSCKGIVKYLHVNYHCKKEKVSQYIYKFL